MQVHRPAVPPRSKGTARSRKPFVRCRPETPDRDSNVSHVGRCIAMAFTRNTRAQNLAGVRGSGLSSGRPCSHRGRERGGWGKGQFRGSRKHRIPIGLSKPLGWVQSARIGEGNSVTLSMTVETIRCFFHRRMILRANPTLRGGCDSGRT
jgi:hypothetical protein